MGDLKSRDSRSPDLNFICGWQAYCKRGAGVMPVGATRQNTPAPRQTEVLAAASQPCLEMEVDAIGRGPGGKRGSTLVDRLSAGEAASEGNSPEKGTTPFSE